MSELSLILIQNYQIYHKKSHDQRILQHDSQKKNDLNDGGKINGVNCLVKRDGRNIDEKIYFVSDVEYELYDE